MRNTHHRNVQSALSATLFCCTIAAYGKRRSASMCARWKVSTAQYDEILGLKKQGSASAVIAALGYRYSCDKYAAAIKVRFPKEHIFTAV
jgi:hypothetical protein